MRSFLKTGQVIGFAREVLVNQGKDQAEQEHIERHGRSITELEAYEAKAIHIRCQHLRGIDRTTSGHDLDKDERLQATQHR